MSINPIESPAINANIDVISDGDRALITVETCGSGI
jgi:hypothetical protein